MFLRKRRRCTGYNFLLELLCTTRSMVPVRTHTPPLRQPWPYQYPKKGSAILLIVIHLFLSTPLITTPQPLFPLILELLSQKPRTTYLTVLFPFFTIIFSVCLHPGSPNERSAS